MKEENQRLDGSFMKSLQTREAWSDFHPACSNVSVSQTSGGTSLKDAQKMKIKTKKITEIDEEQKQIRKGEEEEEEQFKIFGA